MTETQKEIVDDFEETDRVESKFHNFKAEGQQTVIGIIERFEVLGTTTCIVLNTNYTKEGEVYVKLLTALKDQFKEEDVGKKVKIVFTGEKQTGQAKPYMQFDIFKKDMPKPGENTN